MKISHDGDRPRFFAEREKVEAQQGNPLHEGVSKEARTRIVRELAVRSSWYDNENRAVGILGLVVGDIRRIFGPYHDHLRNATSADIIEIGVQYVPIAEFLQVLEMWTARIIEYRRATAVDTLEVIQSLLADDLSAFRLVNVGTVQTPRIQAQLVDIKHLHTVLTDRTFELTRIAEFASAQGDYADAWMHYSRGNTDNALTDAHKAVESACKNVIKKVEPMSTPDALGLQALVAELVRLDIIPRELTHVCGQLEQIFRNSGTLRNQPGAAHGSLDPTSPEASVALLGLRLSGTLIAFLAERWTQLKPA